MEEWRVVRTEQSWNSLNPCRPLRVDASCSRSGTRYIVSNVATPEGEHTEGGVHESVYFLLNTGQTFLAPSLP